MTDANQAIGRDECQQFREQFEAGRSTGEIAAHAGYFKTAVRRHVHDRCAHHVDGGEWGTTTSTDCPLCGETVHARTLADHLPDCAGHQPSEVDA